MQDTHEQYLREVIERMFWGEHPQSFHGFRSKDSDSVSWLMCWRTRNLLTEF
nr:MAG TPA: hypothetical protein [Caudoviricetes sp.]